MRSATALIEVQEKQSGNWVTIAEYTYDATNRPVRKVVTNKGSLNGTTRFLWGEESEWQCLEERDGSGDLVARFVYSPGYMDDIARQERDLNADDDFGDTNEVVYYHASTLYSVYALSDSSESVVERYRFDAYGAATVLDADGSGDADGLSDVGNPYGFTGRGQEVESGLMQYRLRNHSPALGRFISRDPIHYTDLFNLYAYVGDMPTYFADPLGLEVTRPEFGPGYCRDVCSTIARHPYMDLETKAIAHYWCLRGCRIGTGQGIDDLVWPFAPPKLDEWDDETVWESWRRGWREGAWAGYLNVAEKFTLGLYGPLNRLRDEVWDEYGLAGTWAEKGSNFFACVAAASAYAAIGVGVYELASGLTIHLHWTHGGTVLPHLQAFVRSSGRWRYVKAAGKWVWWYSKTKWRWPPH